MPTTQELISQMKKVAPPTPPDAHQASPHSEIDRRKALLKQVRTLREFTLMNRGAVLEGDPAKEYCWVNIREDRQVFFQAMGWELVTDKSGPKVKTHFKQPDGTHKRADVILYQIDKEFYQAICLESELRGLEAVEGAKETFAEALERQGVPVYQPPA